MQGTAQGDFAFGLNGTVFIKYLVALTPNSPLTDQLNTICSPLRLKARATASWRHSAGQAGLVVNHVGGYDNNLASPVQAVAAHTRRPLPTANDIVLADDRGGATLAQVAADRVRSAILAGLIAPGSKLHIQRLSDEFGLELHDQVYRYRIVLRLVPRRKAVTDRAHAELARHALARDADAACETLHRHIDLTMQSLEQVPPEALARAFGAAAA